MPESLYWHSITSVRLRSSICFLGTLANPSGPKTREDITQRAEPATEVLEVHINKSFYQWFLSELVGDPS